MLRRVWSWHLTALVDVAAIAVAHSLAGYLAHRLPPRTLDHDTPLLRPRAWERDGRAYRQVRIDRWKDHLPEAGALFDGGVSKRCLRPGAAGLHELVRVSRRVELAHWGALACGPLFALWNPPVLARTSSSTPDGT